MPEYFSVLFIERIDVRRVTLDILVLHSLDLCHTRVNMNEHIDEMLEYLSTDQTWTRAISNDDHRQLFLMYDDVISMISIVFVDPNRV
jgi:hypothetical protein